MVVLVVRVWMWILWWSAAEKIRTASEIMNGPSSGLELPKFIRRTLVIIIRPSGFAVVYTFAERPLISRQTNDSTDAPSITLVPDSRSDLDSYTYFDDVTL